MKNLFTRIDRRFLLGAGLFAVGIWPLIVLAQEGKSTIKTETLLRTSAAWNDAPYTAYPAGAPEITVLRITVPAHGELPWHKHPIPSAAYLVSGEITVEDHDGRKRHFSAGEVFPETVNTFHHGVVGDQPAVFIVFYAGAKGMPLSQKPE
jgi:quercetin dioxygenase-like cupin family protein